MEDVRNWRGLLVIAALVAAGFTMICAITDVSAQSNKAVAVRVVDKAGYDKVIAANKGKVIVVDCWATWCIPCIKAFPKTVELGKQFADQGVVVVSLSFDNPVKGQAPPEVKDFLTKHHAHFENLISSLDLADDGADAFEIPDGGLPHFKIYGKNGKLIKTFQNSEGNELKHEDIEAAVKLAIKSK